jgi:polar amino acid transport system substrate-binding protein
MAVLLACSGSANAAELRFVLDHSISAPLVIAERQADLPGAKGGILVDLESAIARELGYDAVFQSIPRKRVEEVLQSGSMHVLCHTRPVWLKEPDKLQWSGGFLTTANLLVKSKAGQKLRGLQDLTRGKVGTVLGYLYPELQSQFQSGLLTRDDAENEVTNLARFMTNRVDYFISEQLFLDYQLLKKPALTAAVSNRLVADKFETRCAMSKLAPVSVTQFDAAVANLKKRGEWDAILAAYR